MILAFTPDNEQWMLLAWRVPSRPAWVPGGTVCPHTARALESGWPGGDSRIGFDFISITALPVSFSSAWVHFVPFFILLIFLPSKHSPSITSSRKPLLTPPKPGVGPSLHAPGTTLLVSAVTLNHCLSRQAAHPSELPMSLAT